MIRPSGFWCIGRCGAMNCAIPACARTRPTRMRIGDHCPLDRLDAARCAEQGLLIRRALDLMSALKLAVHIGLDEIRADEFSAMLIVAEQRDLLERERLPEGRNRCRP